MSINQCPGVLVELHAVLKKGLQDNQIEESIADEIALKTTEYLRANKGGTSIYIPKGMVLDNNKRNENIYKEFNGDNHEELCKRYKISIQWLYKILKKSGDNSLQQ